MTARGLAGGGEQALSSASRRPGQHSGISSWPCGRPLLFLQKMMVPLLLASWCLLKTDEPVISPGTGQPFHGAAGRREHGKTQHSRHHGPLPAPPLGARVAYHGPVCSWPCLRSPPRQWWLPSFSPHCSFL